MFTAVSIQTFTLCFCLKQVTEALLMLPYCRRRNTTLKLFVLRKTKPRRMIRNQITELETSLTFQSKVYCFKKNSREQLLVIKCTKNSNYKTLRKRCMDNRIWRKHLSSIVSYILYNSSFFSFQKLRG